jgi:hypothetical protein
LTSKRTGLRFAYQGLYQGCWVSRKCVALHCRVVLSLIHQRLPAHATQAKMPVRLLKMVTKQPIHKYKRQVAHKLICYAYYRICRRVVFWLCKLLACKLCGVTDCGQVSCQSPAHITLTTLFGTKHMVFEERGLISCHFILRHACISR